LITDGRVGGAGVVHTEGSETNSRILHGKRASVVEERFKTVGRVVVSVRVAEKRSKTSCCIVAAGCVTCQSFSTTRRILDAHGVAEECGITGSRVFVAFRIVYKGDRSNRRVLGAGGVEKQRSSAYCRIKVAIIETERYSANTSIPTTGHIAKKRIMPNGRVALAGRKAK